MKTMLSIKTAAKLAICMGVLSTGASAQNSEPKMKTSGKVKVITIHNGDTTITERDITDSDSFSYHYEYDLDQDLDSLIKSHRKDLSSGKRVIIKSIEESDLDIDSLLKSMNINIDINIDGEEKHVSKIISNKDKKALKILRKEIRKNLEDIQIDDDGTKIIYKKMIIKVTEPSKEDLKNQKTGIKTGKKLNLSEINVFPNPGKGDFNITFNLPEKGDTKITITDINGKAVFNEMLPDFTGNYHNQIKLGDEAEGIYFLNVEQNGKQLIKKLIKQ